MPAPSRLILAATLALWGVGAVAQTVPMVVDADGNGSFSLAEIRAAYPDATKATFDRIDTNHDGKVSADELAAAVNAGILK